MNHSNLLVHSGLRTCIILIGFLHCAHLSAAETLVTREFAPRGLAGSLAGISVDPQGGVCIAQTSLEPASEHALPAPENALASSDPAEPQNAGQGRSPSKTSKAPSDLNWERFTVKAHGAFVLLPSNKPTHPVPWVLYAPTLGNRLPNARDEGWMFERWLNAGIAIAGIDVGESYGNPDGRALYNALFETVTNKYGLAPKASLLARSRGGLMLYCWAVENPDRVVAIAGIYPVCDISSYPGVERAAVAYGLTPAELTRSLPLHNPIGRLEELAKAKVPIFHIHGDADRVVPLEKNSGLLATRYRELGGTIELQVAAGQGHNMWPGFFHCEELVDFILQHAGP